MGAPAAAAAVAAGTWVPTSEAAARHCTPPHAGGGAGAAGGRGGHRRLRGRRAGGRRHAVRHDPTRAGASAACLAASCAAPRSSGFLGYARWARRGAPARPRPRAGDCRHAAGRRRGLQCSGLTRRPLRAAHPTQPNPRASRRPLTTRTTGRAPRRGPRAWPSSPSSPSWSSSRWVLGAGCWPLGAAHVGAGWWRALQAAPPACDWKQDRAPAAR